MARCLLGANEVPSFGCRVLSPKLRFVHLRRILKDPLVQKYFIVSLTHQGIVDVIK